VPSANWYATRDADGSWFLTCSGEPSANVWQEGNTWKLNVDDTEYDLGASDNELKVLDDADRIIYAEHGISVDGHDVLNHPDNDLDMGF
jgi:hypothetical protein